MPRPECILAGGYESAMKKPGSRRTPDDYHYVRLAGPRPPRGGFHVDCISSQMRTCYFFDNEKARADSPWAAMLSTPLALAPP